MATRGSEPDATRRRHGVSTDAAPVGAARPALDLAALVGGLGSEIAGPLTAALERVTALVAGGRIDRSELTSLRMEIEGARRAGMAAQLLVRLASGRVPQQPETLHLTQVVRDMLAQRSREFMLHGIDLRQSLQSATVRVDGSYLFALLQALLDWCATHARRRLDIKIEVQSWPLQARLVCRLGRTASDGEDDLHLDSTAWRLVDVVARAMGLELERLDSPADRRVMIDFPNTANELMPGVTAIELDDGFSSTLNSKPLAGSHVLVVASRRELRTAVRDAVRHMGLMVDFASSVDEAREFCQGGVPHAIVFEAALGGGRFATLQRELAQEVPALAFIAIGQDGSDYLTDAVDGRRLTRVGREALASALPAALVFELSRVIES